MIIVDTHAFLWWKSSPRKLGRRARGILENASEVGISAISCWEIAMLVTNKRLRLDRDVLIWIKQALAQPTTRLLPLLPEIAVQAAQLGRQLPGDSADRLIVATAMHHRCPLVTADKRIKVFDQIETVW